MAHYFTSKACHLCHFNFNSQSLLKDCTFTTLKFKLTLGCQVEFIEVKVDTLPNKLIYAQLNKIQHIS